ncbi:MAG: SHOCT domain-containing protein [Nitrososphaerales archaeon]
MGWLLVGLILLLVFAFVIVLTAHFFFRPALMPNYYGGYVFAIFFFPFGILFFFLLVFLIARLIFWPWRGGYRRAYWHHYGDAKEIVKARYARGEITKEQFDQMMRDLEQHA